MSEVLLAKKRSFKIISKTREKLRSKDKAVNVKHTI